jgi:hypothetical protein
MWEGILPISLLDGVLSNKARLALLNPATQQAHFDAISRLLVPQAFNAEYLTSLILGVERWRQ